MWQLGRSRRKNHLSRRRHGRGDDFGDSCATTPRLARSGVGLLIGGMLGAMVGGGVAVAMAASTPDQGAATTADSTTQRLARLKKIGLITTAVSLIGAAGGATVGAWKPEC